LDLPLRSAALHDQLAGEQPETGHILLPVHEHRQVAIVVNHATLFAAVSGERESVYFWRLGIHFFFGGSSSP
jgi:hypothetical protein